MKAKATPELLVEDPINQIKPVNKLNSNFYTRAKAGIAILTSFIFFVLCGQTYIAMVVMLVRFLISNQLLHARQKRNSHFKQSSLTKFLHQYMFFFFNYYCIARTISQKFPALEITVPVLGLLVQYRDFILCLMSLIAIAILKASLPKQNYVIHLRTFGWVLLIAAISVYFPYFMIYSVFEGQIWYVLPAIIVAFNDIFAYIFGYFLGKHQLISLSPKKTWQGYIGGVISTIPLSIFLTHLFIQIPNISCKLLYPTLQLFHFNECNDSLVTDSIEILGLNLSLMTCHMLVITCFICFVGPFGGFFASGLKRFLNIKDFANTIPGHGGLTDRFDCTILVSVFVYFYLHGYIKITNSSFEMTWIQSLATNEKLELYAHLKNGA